MELSYFLPVRMTGKDVWYTDADILSRLAAYGGRAMIVTGKSSAKKSGALDDVLRALSSAGIAREIYDGIGENPFVSSCREAGQRAYESDCHFIIGIGGGSPLDAAKAVAVFAKNPDLSDEALFSLKWTLPPLPIVLVGTTAGTGSEVTLTSVLTTQGTSDAPGIKKSVNHPSLYASLAVCCAKYTYSVPYSVTISTALDALSHAVEGYFSSRASDISDVLAERAVKLLLNALRALEDTPEIYTKSIVRDDLYKASILAGMVLNQCGTCFCHPIGYVLTERYGVPHGRACTAFLPALLSRAEQFMPAKAAALVRAAGFSIPEICRIVDLHTALDPIAIPDGLLDACRVRWQNLRNFAITPGGFTPDDAVHLFASLSR